MLVFCSCIKGMLHYEITNYCFKCGFSTCYYLGNGETFYTGDGDTQRCYITLASHFTIITPPCNIYNMWQCYITQFCCLCKCGIISDIILQFITYGVEARNFGSNEVTKLIFGYMSCLETYFQKHTFTFSSNLLLNGTNSVL